MKKLKKLFSMILCVTMLGSLLSGCSGKKGDDSEDVKKVKVGVILNAGGPQSDATEDFFTEISKEIKGLEFVYVIGDSTDAEANLSTCEGLISQGCNGIITSTTAGLESMAEACEAQNIYLTTYLAKPNSEDEEKMKEYDCFLGGVTDGPISGAEGGEKAAEYIIENGYKNIGLISFPLDVMTKHKESYDAFVSKIEEYNATAEAADQITLQDNEELFFTLLDTSYFAKHPDIDCIYSMAAGVTNVYPPMVQAGVNGKIALVTNGMMYDEDTYAAINSGDIAMTSTSSIEQAFFPLALIYDAVNGQSFDDAPEKPWIEGCGMLYIEGPDDLKAMMDHSYYFRENADDTDRLLLQPADAKQLLKTYNPDATYEGLTAYLSTLTIDTYKNME